MTLLSLLLLSAAVFIGLLTVLCVALPLVVAFLTWMDGSYKQRFNNSRLYIGRVWHTRLKPKRHAFQYPIFMFSLDLEEDFGNFMAPIVRFSQSSHHLINGEGLSSNNQETENDNKKGNSNVKGDSSLAQRILRLVQVKTKGSFRPTLQTHRVMLLTHLSYFGYNFNPVSFYFIISKESNELTAMVGEVSNTPWTEMYCYVLHPDSVDRVQCQNRRLEDGSPKQEYSFPKVFHVSPFMEMEYFYDWTFVGLPSSGKPHSSLNITNGMRRRSTDGVEFVAKLIVDDYVITPWLVAWQMIRFPVFCMLIQIWIHYEALWLFIKGVVYVPHPEGSETLASKTIASVMVPFFAIRDRLNPKSKTA